jgi:hypothetical protein
MTNDEMAIVARDRSALSIDVEADLPDERLAQ